MTDNVKILRASLEKTVRLLVKEGIKVTQRGHQPCVITRGGKILRLNLPEIPENASPGLIAAMQGYLDHECAHIFYTDFDEAERFAKTGPQYAAMLNVIDDIRIEKLLPRDYPGTALNLDRMLRTGFGETLKKVAEQGVRSGDPKTAAFTLVVPAFRALAGQPAMIEFMDAGGYWTYFQPLLDKLPGLADKLKALETHAECCELAKWVCETLKEPKSKTKTPPPPIDDRDEGEGDDVLGGAPGGTADAPEIDEEDEDDAEADDAGASDDEGEAGAGDDVCDSLTKALRRLTPEERRAIQLHHRGKKSLDEIAESMSTDVCAIQHTLKNARKRIAELMRL